MSEPQAEPAIDPQDLAHRKRCINDFRRFQDHIPQHLSAVLDANLTPDGRSALLEILILAIQAGRLLQLEDWNEERAKMLIARAGRVMQDSKPSAVPSNLLMGLLDVNGRALRPSQEKTIEQPEAKPVDILVAPGFALPTKH